MRVTRGVSSMFSNFSSSSSLEREEGLRAWILKRGIKLKGSTDPNRIKREKVLNRDSWGGSYFNVRGEIL